MEPAQQGDDGEDRSRDDTGGEVTLPEIRFCEMARLEMMVNVWLDDPLAQERPFSAAVGVFKPMDKARGEVNCENNADCLHNNQPDFCNEVCVHRGEIA